MAEFAFMKEVLAAFGRGATRLFRCNAGVSWQGLELEHTREIIVLKNPRAIHGWPEGTADLVGWQSVEVTPEMVGQRVAVFVAVETKSPAGRLTQGQRRFLTAVKSAGGLACAARTLPEVAAVLGAPGAGLGQQPAGPARGATARIEPLASRVRASAGGRRAAAG
jgi:hypothetical protein